MDMLAQPPRSGNAVANRRGPTAPRIGRGFPLAVVAIASVSTPFGVFRLGLRTPVAFVAVASMCTFFLNSFILSWLRLSS